MTETDFYPYFTKKEMSCRCGCGRLPLDSFMQVMVTLREECGFPWIITSGARCGDYNYKLTGKRVDPHTLQVALDTMVYLDDAYNLLSVAFRHQVYGVGINQKGKFTSRFIHLDMIKPGTAGFNRPLAWTY